MSGRFVPNACETKDIVKGGGEVACLDGNRPGYEALFGVLSAW